MIGFIARERLIESYQFACEMDVQAFKPGNVSVYADGHDMTVADFRMSAQASAEPITNPDYSLGEKIYFAVKATREAVGCNTNLGIILLCAPMLHALLNQPQAKSLRSALSEVIASTTVADADWVFRAITLASPGGLGEAKEQDVREKPQVTLTQAMVIAADKDRIAFQYKTNYKDIFDFAIFRYNDTLYRWGGSDWAASAVFAGLLRQFPDSHIERKYGNKFTGMVAARMALIDRELSRTDRPERLQEMLLNTDQEFKSAGLNPGTTADLTVATVLAAYLDKMLNKKKF